MKLSFSNNARYLYSESEGLGVDLNSHLTLIQNYVEGHNQLRFANSRLSLFFFCPPSDELFDCEDSWVAREIIGHCQPDSEDQLQVFDAFRGPCLKRDWVLSGWDDLNRDSLAAVYRNAFDELVESGYEVSESWRLEFVMARQERNGYDLKVTMDLYVKE